MLLRVFWLFVLFLSAGLALGAIETPKNQPVEITSTGETTYENGLATAHDNVAIHVGDTDIYADSAQYNSQTHDITVSGNVRIYRDVNLYQSDTAVYNTDTKEIRTGQMRTDYDPYFVSGESVTSISANGYRIKDGYFTTHDSSDPSFHLRARTIRIYEKDYVVFQNVTFYIGKVPVLWWPYAYQSLNDAFSFSVSPSFLSSWGPSLLTQVTFPITDKIKGRLRLDYRSRRGMAVGFDGTMTYGKDDDSWAKVKSYYLQDQDPELNTTGQKRGPVPTGRYRFTLEDYTQLNYGIYAVADVTKLSDQYVMQDFMQSEFRVNPQPDDMIAVAKTASNWTLTAITRFQWDEFFEQTERLPEVVLDVVRTPILGGPIFYEGESGIANFDLKFANDSGFEDYSAVRLDTFHQLTYPNTYFGWLSFVPRIGFRETYYSRTRDLEGLNVQSSGNPLVPDFILPEPTLQMPIKYGDSESRTVVNGGFEASFKLSQAWEDVQSRTFGLDGLRHIIQPFTNFSWVSNGDSDPKAILQFDRYVSSTQLRPIDFPQFTTIDSIDQWTVWRFGVRNRLQSRRDDTTITWLELESYFDVNLDNPYDRTPYSNFFNNLRFTPLPWMSLVVKSQIPAFDKGFTEINTALVVQPIANLQMSFAHRYLNSSPFFKNSSLFVIGGYYRLDDNWGVGLQEQYEATTRQLQEQRYSVYRDLTTWVASLGAVVRDNGSKTEYGVLLTFTLKAFPKFGFDLNFDPGSTTDQ